MEGRVAGEDKCRKEEQRETDELHKKTGNEDVKMWTIGDSNSITKAVI